MGESLGLVDSWHLQLTEIVEGKPDTRAPFAETYPYDEHHLPVLVNAHGDEGEGESIGSSRRSDGKNDDDGSGGKDGDNGKGQDEGSKAEAEDASSLERHFKLAVQHVQDHFPDSVFHSKDITLKLHGLKNAALRGPVKGTRPRTGLHARAEWDAWNDAWSQSVGGGGGGGGGASGGRSGSRRAARDMAEGCMAGYIALVDAHSPSFMDGLLQMEQKEGKGGGGNDGDDDDADADDDDDDDNGGNANATGAPDGAAEASDAGNTGRGENGADEPPPPPSKVAKASEKATEVTAAQSSNAERQLPTRGGGSDGEDGTTSFTPWPQYQTQWVQIQHEESDIFCRPASVPEPGNERRSSSSSSSTDGTSRVLPGEEESPGRDGAIVGGCDESRRRYGVRTGHSVSKVGHQLLVFGGGWNDERSAAMEVELAPPHIHVLDLRPCIRDGGFFPSPPPLVDSPESEQGERSERSERSEQSEQGTAVPLARWRVQPARGVPPPGRRGHLVRHRQGSILIAGGYDAAGSGLKMEADTHELVLNAGAVEGEEEEDEEQGEERVVGERATTGEEV